MTEEDKNDPLYPLYIGPEKLLSLYSENNWGNFCLSYLLTNRDYSGVLGLAWEGKAGELFTATRVRQVFRYSINLGTCLLLFEDNLASGGMSNVSGLLAS